MRLGITTEIWKERARILNLQWVASTPKRNDEKTLIRCLDCGNEWMVFPANLAKGKKSCQSCARLASRVSEAEWTERLAKVNASWLAGTPLNISDNSKKALCENCGETWFVNPRKVGNGHPRCTTKRGRETLGPDIWLARARDAGIEWIETPKRSKVHTQARCLNCGHLWSPIPDNIRSGSSCPICALNNKNKSDGRKVTTEEWGIRAERAGVRWLGEPPSHSSDRKQVVCIKCQHQWAPLAMSISKGSGCPRCAKNAPLPQSVWDERAFSIGIKWLEPVTGRHDKSLAACLKCDYQWRVDAGAVAGGSGCPICNREESSTNRRVKSQVWIERASKLKLTWIELPGNNSDKKLIRCDVCKFEWQVAPSKVNSRTGCPICSGVFVEAATWTQRAAELDIEWLEIPTSSRRPTLAKCLKCDLTWRKNPGSVKSGSGCPDCAETGYKVGQPGLLYLVERTSEKGRPARKIGITNIAGSKTRLNLWKRQGFTLRSQYTHDDGGLILQLETTILRWLRHELGLASYLDRQEMPKGGATETLSPDEPSDYVLFEKIESEFSRLVNDKSRKSRGAAKP